MTDRTPPINHENSSAAKERWLALTQDEQDAENARRKERGEKPIPTHRHWPRIQVSPPIMFSVSNERGIKPVGECLACGHVMELASWKDAPSLSEVTHGLCAPCRDAAVHLRGDCSKERGCMCEAMGEQNARRERELRDRDKRARIALAREESRG